MSKKNEQRVVGSATRLSEKIEAVIRDHMLDLGNDSEIEITDMAFIAMTALAHATGRAMWFLAGGGKENFASREHLRGVYDNMLLDAHAFIEKSDERQTERTAVVINTLRGLAENMPGEEGEKLRAFVEKVEKSTSKTESDEKKNDSPDTENVFKFPKTYRPPRTLN